jgi:hypothetical protein
MLPPADDLHTLLIRTDFADEPAWQALQLAVAAASGPFTANLTWIDDTQYEGLTVERLLALASDDEDHGFVFLADRASLAGSEYPVLVVDLIGVPGRTFRATPSAIWSVQNNLVIANMDWEDFEGALDPDGVFRGFK